MKKTVMARITMSLVTVAAIHLINTSHVTAQKYKIDNDHTSIVFAISHFGFSYTYGRFNQCAGSFDMVDGKPGEQGFEFTIDAKSIDTNCDERDEHLRGPDFFDAQQFPEITLKTTSIEAVDDEYLVTADLTVCRLLAARTNRNCAQNGVEWFQHSVKRGDYAFGMPIPGNGDYGGEMPKRTRMQFF